MLTRFIFVTTAAAVLLGIASIGNAAEDQSLHAMEHQHDVTILHMVETAQNAKDHEAIAQRLDDQAAQFEKQAAEHEKLAAHYRKALSNPKWNHNSSNDNSAVLAAHCDHLAASMKAAAADSRDMAQLHHAVAKMTN